MLLELNIFDHLIKYFMFFTLYEGLISKGLSKLISLYNKLFMWMKNSVDPDQLASSEAN